MKTKEQSREELAASMGIDLSHLTEEEIEVIYRRFPVLDRYWFHKLNGTMTFHNDMTEYFGYRFTICKKKRLTHSIRVSK